MSEELKLFTDAMRYRYLREQDLETIKNGGIFAGLIPDNIVINGKRTIKKETNA